LYSLAHRLLSWFSQHNQEDATASYRNRDAPGRQIMQKDQTNHFCKTHDIMPRRFTSRDFDMLCFHICCRMPADSDRRFRGAPIRMRPELTQSGVKKSFFVCSLSMFLLHALEDASNTLLALVLLQGSAQFKSAFVLRNTDACITMHR
jgi:hypothetical protein